MDFSEYINAIADFYRLHPEIAGAVGILLLFLAYRKPKLFFLIISVAVLLAFLFQLIITTGSSSVTVKQKMINSEMKNSPN